MQDKVSGTKAHFAADRRLFNPCTSVQAQLPEKAFDPVGDSRHLLLFYFAIIKISNIKKTAR
ncbi:MAG TPA: hypothetical protein VF355_05640 [Anaerolineaceae bacterium]